jgi:hypothetical protein
LIKLNNMILIGIIIIVLLLAILEKLPKTK